MKKDSVPAHCDSPGDNATTSQSNVANSRVTASEHKTVTSDIGAEMKSEPWTPSGMQTPLARRCAPKRGPPDVSALPSVSPRFRLRYCPIEKCFKRSAAIADAVAVKMAASALKLALPAAIPLTCESICCVRPLLSPVPKTLKLLRRLLRHEEKATCKYRRHRYHRGIKIRVMYCECPCRKGNRNHAVDYYCLEPNETPI